MKILFCLFFPVIVFSQSPKDKAFCIQELKKIELSKETFFSKLNHEQQELFMLYKNNIKTIINISRNEIDGISNNRIVFLYIIPRTLLKVEPEKTSFIKLVESEILSNNFLLKSFVKRGLDLAKLGIKKSVIETSDGFTLFSTIPDLESEMIIKVMKLSGNNYSIMVDLSVSL